MPAPLGGSEPGQLGCHLDPLYSSRVLCCRISRWVTVAMVMPPLVSRFLLPLILELLVAGLLVFRQDVLETGLELLILVGQLLPLLLQPFLPGLSFRTVSLFECSTGDLHAGPETVTAGLG